ncbi:Acetate kinase (Acetokinase) [Legionella birminghamensis]|uniref:Acetate kinase n=1 Tax=Legionella birminghamensis TaxID=28083 RepID=A0A378IAB3_9GAMM|nr:acetate/propionate family kinase [Legionella birminghamensis]KTC74363.1 Acetate kinase (Acetokinase) [Legionella birminghamensis]STX31722.1 Acetate kinase (Acetokinase) [Legionella birminghamensis]
MNILSINAGSSSIKYKAYSLSNKKHKLLLGGLMEGIGEPLGKWHHHFKKSSVEEHQFSNHAEAFALLSSRLNSDLVDHPISRIGHRVVHGGTDLFEPTLITPEKLKQIKELNFLAPIHNPVNVLGIELAQENFPEAIHVAVFDTGFHHQMPAHVYHYPINMDVSRQYQIRRYGFHGINHEYVARCAAQFLDKPLSACNFISLHLGNGASACLIKRGVSADTSMGLTPLAGLVMGTRCGDIDPAIPLYLLDKGLSAGEVDSLLNKNSGLYGIARDNDMRNLTKRFAEGDPDAKLAVHMYVYSIQKFIGAYLSQLEQLDALIFTGGVGENASLIRKMILTPLKHFNFFIDEEKNAETVEACLNISDVGHNILVIRGDEEAMIAEKVFSLKE